MRGFDVGLEMSGSPKAFIEMIENMYNGSSISLLGILPSNFEVPWSDIIFRAITLKGIYGREMWRLVQDGTDDHRRDKPQPVLPTVQHRRISEGFDVMESGECGKVILDWD
jgi:threonine 3-dehydrogenase